MTIVRSCMLAGMAILLRAAAAGEATVPWLDFANPRTPVDRPIEELACALNGTPCAHGFRASITLEEHPRWGKVAQWRIERAGNGEKKWAVLRTVLPCWYYTRNRNTLAGVRLHLTASKDTRFSFEVFAGANPHDGFYRPARVIGRGKGGQIRAGEQDVVLRWADAGVKGKAPTQVSGYGLVVYDLPITISFSRADLIFDSKAAADTYRAQRDRRLRALQKVMLDALKARGVDLVRLPERLPVAQLEPKVWEGVQLSAMGEELHHWMRIAGRKYDPEAAGSDLEMQRNALIAALARGDEIGTRLEALQSRVDAYVDRLMKTVPLSARRWRVGEDGRFHRPDGRPYRMFGPYFQRLRYAQPAPARNAVMGWSPWDVRYLAGLGFNGMRADITWKRLEPTRGRFDREYVALVKRILREAERYGLGISIDLHWPFPDWFVYGPPGRGIGKGDHAGPWPQNVYHWPEALVSAWRRLAAELADVPNIVAFEVPTNEPTLAATRRGVMDRPHPHARVERLAAHNLPRPEPARRGVGRGGERCGALSPAR